MFDEVYSKVAEVYSEVDEVHRKVAKVHYQDDEVHNFTQRVGAAPSNAG